MGGSVAVSQSRLRSSRSEPEKVAIPNLNGKTNSARDDAGRAVLAAIGLCAGVLASERGTSLRSRCMLRPVSTRKWELLDQPDAPSRTYTMNGKAAIALLKEAIVAAEATGLNWMEKKLTLQPTPELIDLVRKSQEVMAAEDE